MMLFISAEYQKIKRTFTKRVAFIVPIVTLSLCSFLMIGKYYLSGSYNWWYTLMLPAMLTLICTGVIQKDSKKLNYRAILGLPFDLEKQWIGKIGVCVILLFISSLIFFIGATLVGFIFTGPITLLESASGSLIIFLTFLWQIPLCLFLAERLGMFLTVFINLTLNVFCFICFSRNAFWWVPYAIPARLMCPVIKVLPNGLPVPANDPLLSSGVVLPGVILALILFFSLSVGTAIMFRSREAK